MSLPDKLRLVAIGRLQCSKGTSPLPLAIAYQLCGYKIDFPRLVACPSGRAMKGADIDRQTDRLDYLK
jgi:hypothetical protein